MKAPGMGVYGAKTTDEVLTFQVARRPVTVLEDWLDDVDLFFFELTR
jgi:hypothetical protein